MKGGSILKATRSGFEPTRARDCSPMHERAQPCASSVGCPVYIVCQAGRGGFDAKKICDTLRAKGVNMLFVIGGDGTQFAGHLLFEEARTDRWIEAVGGEAGSYTWEDRS